MRRRSLFFLPTVFPHVLSIALFVTGTGGVLFLPASVATKSRPGRQSVEPIAARAKLQERLANLTGGIAIIRTGGQIVQEALDEQYRVRSALHSAYAAVEEGWIPGGGVTLLNATKSLESLVGGNEGANAGIGVMRSAIEAPIRALIATTSESPAKVISDLKRGDQIGKGFNVETSTIEDLVHARVIDPIKSVRLALTLAVAHAKAVLQTGAWELDDIENK